MNVLEAVQRQVNSVGVEQSIADVVALIERIERMPAEDFPAWLPSLIAVMCFHNEALLLWSINGRPHVINRVASDGLDTRDYAG